MQDKLKNWSEGHNRSEDSMHGLGSDLSGDKVDELAARRGMVLLTDCTFCGRQWKGVVPWPEVADYYLMEKVVDASGRPLIAYTKQGIMTMLPCNGCHKSFQIIIDYDEVRQWVETGIRTGCLDPRIKMARARR